MGMPAWCVRELRKKVSAPAASATVKGKRGAMAFMRLKDFDEVLKSVKLAGLASEVARLRARFVVKDGDKADD